MKKSSSLRILSVLALLVVSFSCIYDTDEVYNTPVDKNTTPPEIQTVELNLGEDSVFLYDYNLISFSFKSNLQSIEGVEFLIDGVSKSVLLSDNGIVNINDNSLDEGVHSLELRIYTHTGSGSIADQVNMESYAFSNSWVLVVSHLWNRYLYSGVKDGILRISSPEYKNPDLNGYVLYRVSGLGYLIEIDRSTDPVIADNGYIGEGGMYWIKALTSNGELIDMGYIHIAREYNIPTCTYDNDGKPVYSWKKPKYYGAIKTIQLYEYDIKILETSNMNDTSLIEPSFVFGKKLNLTLKMIPKKVFETSEFTISNDVTLGENYSLNSYVSDLYQVAPDAFVYVCNYDSLIRFSTLTKKKTQGITFTTTTCSTAEFSRSSASPSGKYITSYVGCDFNVMLSNTADLNAYTLHDLKTFSGQMYVPAILISDAGIGLVNSLNGGFYMVDINKGLSLGYMGGASNRGIQISSGGNYLFAEDDSLYLYGFSGGSFSKIASFDRFFNVPKYYAFHPTNPNQLILWDGARLSVHNCIDFSLVREFELAGTDLQHIDGYNQEILIYKPGYLLIYSLLDGSLKKEIPIDFDATGSNNKCILVNGTIVSKSGIFCSTKQ